MNRPGQIFNHSTFMLPKSSRQLRSASKHPSLEGWVNNVKGVGQWLHRDGARNKMMLSRVYVVTLESYSAKSASCLFIYVFYHTIYHTSAVFCAVLVL